MKDLIWSGIGAVITIFAAVYLVKLLKLKKLGIITDAEVIAVKEKKGGYVHTLRFTACGTVCEKDDRSEFNQPFSVGDIKNIVYDPEKPENFEYEDQLKKNIIIVAFMIAVALIFTIKWLISGLT